jgi:uncharacterized membrane protein
MAMEEAAMTKLVSGLLLFFLVHLVPAAPRVRERLSRALGSAPYRALFSLVSIAGLVLIVLGYGELQTLGRGNPQLWVPPVWTRHLVLLLMIPAMILLVAAYVPSRIRNAVEHPMLTAVIIWAFSHLLANGDLASALLFGSFLVYAVFDRVSAQRRAAFGPLGKAPGRAANDLLVVAGGLALYAFMLFWGHAKLIGVPLLP